MCLFIMHLIIAPYKHEPVKQRAIFIFVSYICLDGSCWIQILSAMHIGFCSCVHFLYQCIQKSKSDYFSSIFPTNQSSTRQTLILFSLCGMTFQEWILNRFQPIPFNDDIMGDPLVIGRKYRGHYWHYYPGVLYLSQVIATYFRINSTNEYRKNTIINTFTKTSQFCRVPVSAVSVLTRMGGCRDYSGCE